MEDIELRFLERTEEIRGPGDVQLGRRVRILQCRKKEYVVSGGGTKFYEWGEWADVPLVMEEDA